MNITVDQYNVNEESARQNISVIELRACSPIAFERYGFPTRVKNEAEIYKYFDFGNHQIDVNSLFIRDYFVQGSCLYTCYTDSEADLIRRVSDHSAKIMKSQTGIERRPIFGLLSQFGLFRLIMATTKIFGQKSVSVFEIGPGAGYLGALLTEAGQSYASTDITQSLYLWQNRLLSRIAGNDFCEWALGSDSRDTDQHRVHHIPWWDYIRFRKNISIRADIIVSNAALTEMTTEALHHTAHIARTILKDSPIGMFFYSTIGSPQECQHDDVKEIFAKFGFRMASDRLCFIYSREYENLPKEFSEISFNIPLYGSGPAHHDALDVLQLGTGEDRKLPQEIDFLSFIGNFTPPQQCLSLSDNDHTFFRSTKYPPPNTARKTIIARRAAETRLPAGRVCVYPLGEQTKSIIEILERRPEIEIVALLDRSAKPAMSYRNHLVITPEQLMADNAPLWDYILVSHHNEIEFLSNLHTIGVSPQKIVSVHQDAVKTGWTEEEEEAARINLLLAAWRGMQHNYGRE